MTASELKFKYETNYPDSKFFERSSMEFFGDTMRNFGVCSAIIDSNTESNIDCWRLYRKHSVKHGIKGSFYFRKDSFKLIHKKIGG